jgi:hypothetical protein
MFRPKRQLVGEEGVPNRFTFLAFTNMNTKYIFIVAAMAVVLVGATALATEDAIAKYGKSQAVSQTNACGNGDMAMYIGCQNIDSQIHGDNNRVTGAAAQSFDN